MQLDDLPQFKQLLTSIGVLYGKPVPETLLEIWWNALAEVEFGLVKKALEAYATHLDKGQFMPKPADVVCFIQGKSGTQALQAWSQVAEAIRTVGSYASVVFDDALIHAVIADMGGWIGLCQTSLKELPFRAKEFEKRYEGYVTHPPPHYPKQLMGWEEKQNCLNDYPLKPPLLLGNTQSALSVFKNGKERLLKVQSLPLSSYPLLEN